MSESAAPATGTPSNAPDTTAGRLRRGLDLRTRRLKTTQGLVLGVAGVPTAALLTVGIIVLSIGSAVRDVVLGILIIGMAATVATGVVVTSILLRREAELARLQSEFVSRVSHDLRTPLTSIQMFVETLQLGRADRDPEVVRECIDALGAETSRLLGMVERLLDWARIESASRVYVERHASVASIVDAALAAFDPLQVQDNVDLVRDVPDDLPDLEVDSDAMRDALLNLLQNAYYYTPDTKHIRVRARLADDKIELSVLDNGAGVAPGERNRIFERFYRGTASKLNKVGGTGLGLAMVRATVRAHRGQVRVEANEPVGSVFTIALPIADRPR